MGELPHPKKVWREILEGRWKGEKRRGGKDQRKREREREREREKGKEEEKKGEKKTNWEMKEKRERNWIREIGKCKIVK